MKKTENVKELKLSKKDLEAFVNNDNFRRDQEYARDTGYCSRHKDTKLVPGVKVYTPFQGWKIRLHCPECHYTVF